MKRLLISLLLLAYVGATKAQQNYRMHFGFQGGLTTGINVFNNKNYVSNLYMGPIGGVYADFCLYKRLWLFSSFNIGYGFNVIKNKDVLPYNMDNENGYLIAPGNLAVAYRITKDSSRWQLYPYLGTAKFWSRGFYTIPLIGFEANKEFKKRGNFAVGFNWTFRFVSFGTPRFSDRLGLLNLYVKIGFGTLKRKK